MAGLLHARIHLASEFASDKIHFAPCEFVFELQDILVYAVSNNKETGIILAK